MPQEELRRLPAVHKLLEHPLLGQAQENHAQPLLVAAARQVLEAVRSRILEGSPCPPEEELAEAVLKQLARMLEPSLKPVINATGVIIHTNLGRAPLSEQALAAMREVSLGYSNLEYDLAEGERGSRWAHAAEFLCRLSGAEDALVVNNNAAATLLVLTVLAAGKEVLISRSQLVEIGGGFRIPEVMAQSGAQLREVGTTNRTYLRDYEEALNIMRTGALLRVHRSNFQLIGFVTEPTLAELVELGQRYGVPVIDDLGSGTLLNTEAYGLAHEPTLGESIAAGADIVTASGDKLMGGPQAGLILGRASLIDRLRKHPLTRALRVDKLTLAGLQATLLAYLEGSAEQEIPVWRMIAAPADALARRARKWLVELEGCGVPVRLIDGESAIGGGSLPGQTLPTTLLAIEVPSPAAFAARLRAQATPIIARIAGQAVLLDPRTVLPQQDEAVVDGVKAALSS